MPKDNYRQVRITYTEEPGGRITVALWVKPARAPWHHKHRAWYSTYRVSDPPDTLVQVLSSIQDDVERAKVELQPPR